MFESALVAAIVAFIKGLFGIKPKDPMQEAEKHALEESQEDAKAFSAPDRNKSDVIDAFKLHRDD